MCVRGNFCGEVRHRNSAVAEKMIPHKVDESSSFVLKPQDLELNYCTIRTEVSYEYRSIENRVAMHSVQMSFLEHREMKRQGES